MGILIHGKKRGDYIANFEMPLRKLDVDMSHADIHGTVVNGGTYTGDYHSNEDSGMQVDQYRGGSQNFRGATITGSQVQGSHSQSQFKACEGSSNGPAVGVASAVCCETKGTVCCGAAATSPLQATAKSSACPRTHPYIRQWSKEE